MPAGAAAAAAAAGGGGGQTGGGPLGAAQGEEEEEGIVDMSAELDGAASPPPPPFARLPPSVAPSPDAGMLWEGLPAMGISPAVPFLTGHPLHGGLPPPVPPSLTTAGAAGTLVGGGPDAAGGVGGGGQHLPGAGSSHKPPGLSPALLAQVRLGVAGASALRWLAAWSLRVVRGLAEGCMPVQLLLLPAVHSTASPSCLGGTSPPHLRLRPAACCGWTARMPGLPQTGPAPARSQPSRRSQTCSGMRRMGPALEAHQQAAPLQCSACEACPAYDALLAQSAGPAHIAAAAWPPGFPLPPLRSLKHWCCTVRID